jgi:TPR repeat protein
MHGLGPLAISVLTALLLTACSKAGKVGDACAKHTDCGDGLVCAKEQKCRPAVPEGPASGQPPGASGASVGTGAAAAANIPATVPICYVDPPCEAGDFEACTKGCDSGDAVSCRVLWRWYGFDSTTAAQHDEAKTKQFQQKQVELDEAACKKKEPCACGRLFDNFAKGQGVTRDAKEAVARARLGCDLGDPASCDVLGDVYTDGFPVDVGRDRGTAREFYERAVALRSAGCDRGNQPHCAFLAGMIERGVGIERSTERAMSIARKACDAGEGLGCAQAARWYRQGRPGIPKEPRAARDGYERACKLGRKEFCPEVKSVEAESPSG